MTYSDADHRIATARMRHAQERRFAVLGIATEEHPEPDLDGIVGLWEESARALESMAPENTGRRRHRAQTVTFRSEIAARTDRTTARHRRWADGPQPSPGPNRAQRRANPGKGTR